MPPSTSTATIVADTVKPYFDTLSHQVASLRDDIAELKAGQDVTQRTLRGHNGAPGLVAQVTSLKDSLQDHVERESVCPIQNVIPLLYGNPRDATSPPGVLEQVRELTVWKKNFERIYWLLVGAIVIGVANLIINGLPRLITFLSK